MSAYKTIVVGTDGSKSSILAVERAAAIASAVDATLIIGCAYYKTPEDASRTLRADSVVVLSEERARENFGEAEKVAKAAGAKYQTEARVGSPAEALMGLVSEFDADLLVVGNRGTSSLTGRLIGSGPSDVARQSDCDVMIVRTV